MIYRPSRTTWWLLSWAFCLGSCASSTRVSDLVSPMEGIRVVLLQPRGKSGPGPTLTLVNQSEDPEIKKGYRTQDLKEIDDKLMAAFVTTLEDEGFLRAASRGRPSHSGNRLILHLDEGSFHLCYEANKRLYFRCLEIFSAIYTRVRVPIGSADSTGRKRVDFEAQQRQLLRMNLNRQKRTGGRR